MYKETKIIEKKRLDLTGLWNFPIHFRTQYKVYWLWFLYEALYPRILTVHFKLEFL